MAGPWEKYQTPAAPADDGPWAKYQQPQTAADKYAAEDAATEQANKAAPWYEQFGTGLKTQTGRTLLGINELAQNLDEALPAAAKALPLLNAVPALAAGGRALFGDDPQVLAEAEREADRRDKGTGGWGTAGNLAGDVRNYIGAGAGTSATLRARTLFEAAKQAAKTGAIAGATTGLTESTGDADSTLLTNLKNAAVGAGLGGAIGGALPVAGAGVKKAAVLGAGGLDRLAAFAGSDTAASRVAYRNMADALAEQGFSPGEVASIIDGFRANGVDATLGQMTRSNALLAREKNLLQGGGKASRVMSEGLADNRQKLTRRMIDEADALAQPDQTRYLYEQAASLADAPTARTGADGVMSMGQSATRRELPFTLNAIEEGLTAQADELPPAVVNTLNRYIAEARADGGFAGYDTLKKRLDDLYKDAALTTDQDAVNRAVLGWRRMLNDALEWAGGDTYQAAKTGSKRDMAARELRDAAATSKAGSVKTALNKVYATPEQQAEFLRKLPDDATRSRMRELFDQLDAAGSTFGGSDTSSNLGTAAAMAGETGIGFNPKLDPTSVLDRVTAPLQRRVREQQAKAALGVDADQLANAMRRGQPSYTPPGVGTRLTAREAAKAALETKQEARTPSAPASVKPTPQAKAPQAGLLDKMAMAESSGNPDAKAATSSASGLFQFTDPTWKEMVLRYGQQTGITLADKHKPQAQRTMAALYARQNLQQLQQSLDRLPTQGELYMAHVLGATGAKQLIRAARSDVPAAKLFSPKVVNANKPLFYRDGKPLKAKDLYALLESKVS